MKFSERGESEKDGSEEAAPILPVENNKQNNPQAPKEMQDCGERWKDRGPARGEKSMLEKGGVGQGQVV